MTNVFDLDDRHGLLVTGKTLEGKVLEGMTLQDESHQQARVLGLEFLSPRDIETGEVTILVERTEPSPVRPDAVLTEIQPE